MEDSLERHTLMDDYRPPPLFGEAQLCSGAEWGVCRPWFACAWSAPAAMVIVTA